MFLEMTPAIHQMNSIPGPTDRVALNMAVESFSYHVKSGDMTGKVAKNLKTSSINDEASLSQSNGMYPKEDKAKPHPASDMHTNSLSSPAVEDHLEDAILPVGQNNTQDAVATTLTAEFLSPATIFKRRLEITKDLIVCPGVYDGFSARIALSVGFDALYMVSNISFATPCNSMLTSSRQVQAPRPLASASLT